MRPSLPMPKCARVSSSERLPDTEKEVEVARLAHVRRNLIRRRTCIGDDDGIDGRIQVIAEIQTDRPDGGIGACSDSHCVRKVVEAAKSGAARARMLMRDGLLLFVQIAATCPVGLTEAKEAG